MSTINRSELPYDDFAGYEIFDPKSHYEKQLKEAWKLPVIKTEFKVFRDPYDEYVLKSLKEEEKTPVYNNNFMIWWQNVESEKTKDYRISIYNE